MKIMSDPYQFRPRSASTGGKPYEACSYLHLTRCQCLGLVVVEVTAALRHVLNSVVWVAGVAKSRRPFVTPVPIPALKSPLKSQHSLKLRRVESKTATHTSEKELVQVSLCSFHWKSEDTLRLDE